MKNIKLASFSILIFLFYFLQLESDKNTFLIERLKDSKFVIFIKIKFCELGYIRPM